MPRRRQNEEAYDDGYYDGQEYGGGYDDEYDQGHDDGYDDDSSYQGGYDNDDDYDYDEVIIDDEDDYGINLQSKKKAGRYRIVSVIFLLLVIGASAFVFFYKQQVSQNSLVACWKYQQTVEGKVADYARTNGLSANPAYIEDVPGIMDVKFECPDGGEFTWNPVDGTYVCSAHGHYPQQFAAPESTVTGTEVTAVTDE